MRIDAVDPLATESAIIVVLPQAEQAVGVWRTTLDPAALLGIPAHVTILYPFVRPDQIENRVLANLRKAVRSISRFEIELTRVEWFERRVVWLAPEPDRPFRALSIAVSSEFPEYLPYGGEHAEFIPHLTIGADASLAKLELAGRAISDHLPIRAQVSAAQLFCGSRDAWSWRCVAELPLGS
jgi:2'-5' RNA ligase